MKRAKAPRPVKKELSSEELEARYQTLRARCIERIASRLIYDTEGQDLYRARQSAFAVVGRYRVAPSFISSDRALKEIHSGLDDLERFRAIERLAQKLGA